MSPDFTEMAATIAFCTLSAIFISAFVILIIICRKQKLYYKTSYLNNNDFSRPEIMLIQAEQSESDETQLNLDKILSDEQWIDDATGLIPHCLSIIKICRFLTERLTGLAMGATQASESGLSRIVEGAKCISSRVDDMVTSMYPPLEPRLLEVRAAALSLAVKHLALISKNESGQRNRSFVWIDKSITEIEVHIHILKEAAETQIFYPRIQPNSVNTTV